MDTYGTAGLLIGLGGTAQAAVGEAQDFPNGWSKVVKAHICGINEDDWLVVYPTSGNSAKYLATKDRAWSIPLSVLCSNGKSFSVYVSNGVWLAISYYPPK